jgi:pyruvate dehydrogenase E2 component (dihydrolipoamide acetyltransferase)
MVGEGERFMPDLTMPKMGDAMEEGTILRWLKNEGDRVEEEEAIAEIDTEKATIEIPSYVAGILTRILVQPGQTVPVNTPIAVIGGEGEAPATGASANGQAAAPQAEQKAEAKPEPKAEAKPAAQPAEAKPAAEAQSTAEAKPEGGRVKATGLAKKVAAEHSLDLRGVEGTGPGGRIVEADVTAALSRVVAPTARAEAPTTAAASIPAPPAMALAGTQKPLSNIRKVIARRLSQSKQTIPHFYLSLEVDMRAAMQLRKQFNAAVEESRKVSVNDLVVRAVAVTLVKHPALGSRLEGEVVHYPSSVNVGVAVSLEEGLIVPVVRDAAAKSLTALGAEIRTLADRARKGQLKPDEYSGGTFSITNLGMYEIEQFQAIINPPEAAILAVGAVRETPIVENGAVVPGQLMNLTISVDHRLVDGQMAALFLRDVKHLLQTPLALFS